MSATISCTDERDSIHRNIERTNMTTIQKLEKTRATIGNHIRRGNGLNENYRSWELVDRYDDLKEIAKQEDVWNIYCIGRGSDPSHEGYDLFA